jgi:uncharacterized protein
MIFATAWVFAGLVAGSVGASSASVDGVDPHRREIETWRAQRVERLKAPAGWLSLVGLHWIEPGESTLGSAKDNAIVLAKGPPKLGKVNLADGKVTLTVDPQSGAKIDGSDIASATLRDDHDDKPSMVTFGTTSFLVIDRGGKKALRVKDTEAETRTKFLGIDYYDIDPSWRIEARWVAFDPPRELDVPTVLGTVEKFPVPGKAVFERDGKTYELLPVLEAPGDKELFLIFADRTSGKATYGAGRFLYAPMPVDGKIVLDFNKAYNPPCAFTPYATCPLAPPENRLALPVTAGEKKYRGEHH